MTRKIKNPGGTPEGLIGGVPYNTDLVNINGCRIHFWLGDMATLDRARHLRQAAERQRDIVSCTYSGGQPDGFWAASNFNVGETL